MKNLIISIGKFFLELIGGLIAYTLMLCLLAALSFVAMLAMAPPFYIDGGITALLYGGNMMQIADASIGATGAFFMHILYLPIEYMFSDLTKAVNTIALAVGTKTAVQQSFPWGLKPDWALISINVVYYGLLAFAWYRNKDQASKVRAWLSSHLKREEQVCH